MVLPVTATTSVHGLRDYGGGLRLLPQGTVKQGGTASLESSSRIRDEGFFYLLKEGDKLRLALLSGVLKILTYLQYAAFFRPWTPSYPRFSPL